MIDTEMVVDVLQVQVEEPSFMLTGNAHATSILTSLQTLYEGPSGPLCASKLSRNTHGTI